MTEGQNAQSTAALLLQILASVSPNCQKAGSKAKLLLEMLASFSPNCQDICTRRICRGQSGLQKPNGEPNCTLIATAALELSKLLDDEVLIFEDEDGPDRYDYCTGYAFHHGWGQTLLEEQVIYSSVKGWY